MKIIQISLTLLFLVLFACSESPTTAEVKVTEEAIPSVAVNTANNEKVVVESPKEELSQNLEETTGTKGNESEDKSKEELPEKNKKEVAAEKKQESVKSKKKKKAKKRSKVKFKETEFDFGSIKQGEQIKHDFVFENVGNADLEILNVDVTCGCTVPTFPFIPIEPGEKGTIGITYNSTGKLGNQRPMITVVTNARPHTYKLYLRGVVDAERAKEK